MKKNHATAQAVTTMRRLSIIFTSLKMPLSKMQGNERKKCMLFCIHPIF